MGRATEALLLHVGAKSKDHCNAHAGSALFRDMRDVRLMKASANTPAHAASQSHHIQPSSSAHAQPAAWHTAAGLSRLPAQANPTGLPRSAAAAHPATATANAPARAARRDFFVRTAETVPARAAFVDMPTGPARQPAKSRRQRLNLSEIWGDAHLDREVQQQAARLRQHTAELDDEWEADVGPHATAASQAARSASLAQASALPRAVTPVTSASATSASDQDASTTTAEFSQPASSGEHVLPPLVRDHTRASSVGVLANPILTRIVCE